MAQPRTDTASPQLPAMPWLADHRGPARLEVEQAMVAWFCSDRGFGQLRTPDGELVYVDHREILREGFRTLEADQQVTWVRGHDQHGAVARRVAVVEATTRSAIAS